MTANTRARMSSRFLCIAVAFRKIVAVCGRACFGFFSMESAKKR